MLELSCCIYYAVRIVPSLLAQHIYCLVLLYICTVTLITVHFIRNTCHLAHSCRYMAKASVNVHKYQNVSLTVE